MVSAVRRKIEAPGGDSPTLREALAELYLADGQRERALRLHLELGRPSVLDFVQRHGLLPMCANLEGTHDANTTTNANNTLARLARLDPRRAATMLAGESRQEPSRAREVTVRALTEAVNAADVRVRASASTCTCASCLTGSDAGRGGTELGGSRVSP